MKRAVFGIAIAAGVALALFAQSAEQNRIIDTKTGRIAVETVATGLERPWSIAFLPDGRMLVTERPGRLRLVTLQGEISQPLSGLPQIAAGGQGGLLDVALAPDFATSRFVYFSFSEPGEGGASTAVARARFTGTALENVETIFRQRPKVGGGNHFGSRLVFARDGTLYITTGERFRFEPSQDLASHLGKVIRINADGSVPRDNPFVARTGALPEIFSYGHRNVEGAALHPETGVIWTNEMGPRGGDELNVIEPGRNYGWPLVSWGNHYDGRDIPDHPTRPEFAAPVRYWNPVIAPSGMTFYTGNAIPAWRGNLLIGGMVAQAIVRLTLDDRRVTAEERIALGARIRDVVEGPDGAVYAATDEGNGRILRLTAAR